MTESGAAPTGSARAFLSYTRLDDEFFGGAITSLRRLFELGVQVVTGDRSFEIFQDIDGIELGQKWQKRINEAILGSSFLDSDHHATVLHECAVPRRVGQVHRT